MALSMVGAAAVDAGMGIVNNASNLIFGKKVQKQQLEGQKKALEQQNAASMDIWNKTNYGAQMGHLKAAGLNPGLIYGMGGSGGQTGNASVGGIQGAGAPGKIMDMQSIAQLKLLEAQRENIEADTKNKQADAGFTTGAKTGETVARTANLGADTVNKGVQKIGMELENSMKAIELNYQGETLADRIKSVSQQVEAAKLQIGLLENQKEVSDATKATMIKQAKADLATTLLDMEATRMGMRLTDAQIDELRQKIQFLPEEFKLRARSVEQGQQSADANSKNAQTTAERLKWDQMIHDVADSMKLSVETVQDILQAITLKGIMGEPAKQGGRKRGYDKWGTMTKPGGYDLK